MPIVKNMSSIVGSRYFGACDFFKIGEEGREMYVRTKFVHCTFLPCVAKKSFLVTSDGRTIKLPAVVGRSVRWAWLRAVAWVCAIVAILGVILGILPIEVRRKGPVTKAWWPWALVTLSAVFLGLAIFITFYKPKASEESKQKYQRYLLGLLADSRRRLGQASQDRHEQMAAAAAVHGGPADEVVTIEPHPHCPGPRKDNANVPMTASPTSNPTTGNPKSTSIATGYDPHH
ncbi:uncharacterized protein LOC144860582 [Branchiostoma floridae x Branchiostoma japonicum]